MTKEFLMIEGTQHFEGAASLGIFQVSDRDGGSVNFGVGWPGRRATYTMAVGETRDIPDLGSLTCTAVHVGTARNERTAVFQLNPA
jgi:hypothetical protein